MDPFLRKLGIELPIIQAPMAGVSTPEMAATVSNAGGLGSIGVGSVDAETTRQMIAAVRSKTDRPFNVNVFCHPPASADVAREAAWLTQLEPEFARYGAQPPPRLTEIYQTFLTDDEKLAVLLAERPAIVSFHFGLPAPDRIQALRIAGLVLLATVTNLEEGKAVAAAGIDAVVAQGYEAGGHRGVFDPNGPDDRLGTMALTQLLVRTLGIPVIAAGGIMDGAGIAASLMLGSVAAQLGTAFIACPESSADAGYRAALLGPPAEHTMMTLAISGRPARCLANRFTALGMGVDQRAVPDYPIAYDAGKSLHAAAKATGEFGYGAQWAGQGPRGGLSGDRRSCRVGPYITNTDAGTRNQDLLEGHNMIYVGGGLFHGAYAGDSQSLEQAVRDVWSWSGFNGRTKPEVESTRQFPKLNSSIF